MESAKLPEKAEVSIPSLQIIGGPQSCSFEFASCSSRVFPVLVETNPNEVIEASGGLEADCLIPQCHQGDLSSCDFC